VVCGWAAVVLVVGEVVEVGRVVEEVEGGEVVAVVELLGARAAVETVEVVEVVERSGRVGRVPRVGELVDVELLGTAVVAGPTRPGSVVDVIEVVVDVAPLAVLDGVWGDDVPEVDVVGAVVGTAPGGVSGTVVVVDEVLVTTGWSVGVGKLLVVDGTEVVDSGVVVEVVGLVVVVVVVVGSVVVDDVVGTVVVVVVVGVVVVRPAVVVVVVVAAVVVVADDDGGNSGVDNDVVSASAVIFGETNAPSARPVANTAPPDVATSRASHLLKLCEDKRIRAPNVCKSGRQSQLAAH
jgi:hypothetical protein